MKYGTDISFVPNVARDLFKAFNKPLLIFQPRVGNICTLGLGSEYRLTA